MSVSGRLLPASSIEAVVKPFEVPSGLQQALALHRRAWLSVLRRGNLRRIESELKDPAVRSYLRERYQWDFGALVAVVHHGGRHAALDSERRRGTLLPERWLAIVLIDGWLRRHGQQLAHLRVDPQEPGPRTQRRRLVQGVHENVDDLLAFNLVAREDAYDATYNIVRGSGARRALEGAVRAARAQRRRRTGAATPSWRAHGPLAVSLQAFRKTELFALLRPFFKPAISVDRQAGPHLSDQERERLSKPAGAARRWLALRPSRKAPASDPGLKAGTPPRAALELPPVLLRDLERLLSARDLVALRAVLTAIAARINYTDLPARLGSGVAALRRVRALQAAPVWEQVHPLLRRHLPTLPLDRLERRRKPFKRRRRAG